MRKSKKAKLRSQADRLWFGKLLKPKCEICEGKAIQVHHFFYKSSYGHLRYDENNGVSLCQHCHFLLHTRDPKIIVDKIIEARGKEWYINLKAKALLKPKSGYQNIGWYNEAIKKYE